MLSSKSAPFGVTGGFKGLVWAHYIADCAAVDRLSHSPRNQAAIV